MPSVRLERISILIKFIRVSIDLRGAPQKLCKVIQTRGKNYLHVCSRNIVSSDDIRRTILLDVVESAVSILWLAFEEQQKAIVHAYQHQQDFREFILWT